MNDHTQFLGLDQSSEVLLRQLSDADDSLECFQPDLDVCKLLNQLLAVAVGHHEQAIRNESLNVLGHGLMNHSKVRIDLNPLGQALSKLSGDELLVAIHVISLSCDPSLVEYVKPFLAHRENRVRGEAASCLAELQLDGQGIQ